MAIKESITQERILQAQQRVSFFSSHFFFFFFSDVLNTLVVGKSVAVRRTEGPRWGVCALVSEGDHRRARDDDLRQSTSQPAVRMHMIDRQLSDTTSEQTASKAASAFSVIS